MSKKPKEYLWECSKCKYHGDTITVCPGICGGEIVDILDYWCPHCGNDKIQFLGTQEEKDKWWDAYWKDQVQLTYEETKGEAL